MIWRSLAFAHTGFRRLLGKQTNPDFAAAFDESRHSNTAGFNLPVGNPARLKHFQSIISESQLASAPCLARHASALLLAVLNFFRHQHKSLLAIGHQLKRASRNSCLLT